MSNAASPSKPISAKRGQPEMVVVPKPPSWRRMFKALGVTPRMIIERWETDDAFFWVGACLLDIDGNPDVTPCTAFDVFIKCTDLDDIHTFYLCTLDYDDFKRFEMRHSHKIKNIWHFLYLWWKGMICPFTVGWDSATDVMNKDAEEEQDEVFNRLRKCSQLFVPPADSTDEEGDEDK